MAWALIVESARANPSARRIAACRAPSASRIAACFAPSATRIADALFPSASVTEARRVRSAVSCRFMASWTSRWRQFLNLDVRHLHTSAVRDVVEPYAYLLVDLLPLSED